MIKIFDFLAHWGERAYQANHEQIDSLVSFYGAPVDKNPSGKTEDK